MDINEFAKEIYKQNVEVGWWDNKDRCLWETLQLVSTEIAEATEGERKDLMDAHLPHRKMGEVELADALIRVLDFGAHNNLTYLGDRFYQSLKMANWSVGRKHLHINKQLIVFVIAWENGFDFLQEKEYSNLICAIYQVAESLGYDIESAAEEKLLYNKTRSDHKRENRLKENGKKF